MIYTFRVTTSSGEEISLEKYQGRVLLIVNVASRCSFTPQYAGLQSLHEKYSDRGLSILAFPCNQFGYQEPGSDTEIASFCSVNFKTEFDLFAKIDVNGPNASPLYTYLKKEAPGLFGLEGVKWNFTKFLVGRDGTVLKRYFSWVPPRKLELDIERALETDGSH